jgi:hypothetical protein
MDSAATGSSAAANPGQTTLLSRILIAGFSSFPQGRRSVAADCCRCDAGAGRVPFLAGKTKAAFTSTTPVGSLTCNGGVNVIEPTRDCNTGSLHFT